MNIPLFIPLLFVPDCEGIWIREITGRDELSLREVNTVSAIDLIDRLLIKHDSGVSTARAIATADRDRIFAALYRAHFGSKIEGLLTCAACKKKFEVNFLLQDLESHLQFSSRERINTKLFTVGEQCTFRVPTGEDELAVAHFPSGTAEQALLRRCVVSGDAVLYRQEIEERLSGIAPVLQTELDTRCAECGAVQKAGFDIQTYFLTRLKQQQPIAYRQLHRLASTYKWSHDEIIELPVRIRKQYVKLIESDLEARYERR